MNPPVADFHPASILQIEGDPTLWGLETVAPQDPGWQDDPVAIAVGSPVQGTLILSPARVGGFALTSYPGHNGWMPADLPAGSRFLYIPTVKGMTAATAVGSGYLLAASNNDLNALQEKIMNAMSDPDSASLALNIDEVGGGVVILNGAQLPFAVLYPTPAP